MRFGTMVAMAGLMAAGAAGVGLEGSSPITPGAGGSDDRMFLLEAACGAKICAPGRPIE